MEGNVSIQVLLSYQKCPYLWYNFGNIYTIFIQLENSFYVSLGSFGWAHWIQELVKTSDKTYKGDQIGYLRSAVSIR